MTTGERPIAEPAIDPEATCLGCGYFLRELREPRCPECGRAFDANDSSTYRWPGDRRILKRIAFALAPIAAWTATCLALVLIYAAHFRFINRDNVGLVMAIVLLTVTGIRSRVRKSLLRGQPKPAPRSERAAKIAFYFLIAAFFVTYNGLVGWSCPHGTGWGIGGVGIAFSRNGGPCHNNVEHLQAWQVRGNFYVWTSW